MKPSLRDKLPIFIKAEKAIGDIQILFKKPQEVSATLQLGAKSIFYHELGHSALGGDGEIAATQAGIRWVQEVLLEPSPMVNDLTEYIRYLEGR